jgi:ferrochelatase
VDRPAPGQKAIFTPARAALRLAYCGFLHSETHPPMPKRAVLLVNLGSPDSTSVPDVRRYLREFLGDERVLDLPAPLRWLLLEGIILRTRPKKSAHAYEQIWTKEGSPLILTSQSVQRKLAAVLGSRTPVYLAMRYGRPSIASVIGQIAADGIDEVLLFPQYPHYAMSSWETVVVKVTRRPPARRRNSAWPTVQPFYADADYIEALHTVSAPYLAQPHDFVLFSYHGIPVRHLRKADSSRGPTAPSSPTAARPARRFTRPATRPSASRPRGPSPRGPGSPPTNTVSFQSRLAGEPWLSPFTDHELARLAREGRRRLLVLCPAFVSDCLETIEEISGEGKETFLAAGGESFTQIPCLNDHPAYVDFLATRTARWLETGSV